MLLDYLLQSRLLWSLAQLDIRIEKNPLPSLPAFGLWSWKKMKEALEAGNIGIGQVLTQD